jgi:hypothetical protein
MRISEGGVRQVLPGDFQIGFLALSQVLFAKKRHFKLLKAMAKKKKKKSCGNSLLKFFLTGIQIGNLS